MHRRTDNPQELKVLRSVTLLTTPRDATWTPQIPLDKPFGIWAIKDLWGVGLRVQKGLGAEFPGVYGSGT